MGAIWERAGTLGPFGCIHLQVEAGTADFAELVKIVRLEEMKIGELSEFRTKEVTIRVFRSSDTEWDINIVAGMDGVLGRY